MENSRPGFYFLVLCCASLLFPTCCSSKHIPLFIFGDSFFEAGNNNYIRNAFGRANFWPYGETFFKYPTGRFSDGRVIPDFIAEYAKLPFIPPYLQPGNHQITDGVNFASGAAGALAQTRPAGSVIDLNTQAIYFKNVERQISQKLGDKETKKLLSKAIYMFNIGSNDYVAPFTTNSSLLQAYSRKEYVGMVIGNTTTVIKEIYRNGGRKFVFVSMGPLGCLPFLRASNKNGTGGCMDEVTVFSKLHNSALIEALKELQTQLQGFKYAYFDFYTSLSERIKRHSKYGFEKGKVACCGSGPYRGILSCGGRGAEEYQLCDNPSDYLFFDGGHLTEKANNQLAKLMWSGNSNVIWPYNLKTLFQE